MRALVTFRYYDPRPFADSIEEGSMVVEGDSYKELKQKVREKHRRARKFTFKILNDEGTTEDS